MVLVRRGCSSNLALTASICYIATSSVQKQPSCHEQCVQLLRDTRRSNQACGLCGIPQHCAST